MEYCRKAIEGYEGIYDIDTDGNVFSLARTVCNGRGFSKLKARMLKGGIGKNGYINIGLCKKGIVKSCRVHRLIAIAFIPNPENKPQVNHIDGNKQNNKVNNLEWVTDQENVTHAWKTGLADSCGEKRFLSKLKESEVVEIRNIYAKGSISQHKLGKIYGVGASVICEIVNNKAWKHVKF